MTYPTPDQWRLPLPGAELTRPPLTRPPLTRPPLTRPPLIEPPLTRPGSGPGGPQHAAPSRQAPVRVHAQRALRLFAAVGAWGAGLCLIIGLVALVAKAGGVGAAAPVAAETGPTASTNSATVPAPPRTAPRHVIKRFSGTGDKETRSFRVGPHRRWGLRWSYRCPAGGPTGRLIIAEGHAANSGLVVDAAGRSRHDTHWASSDGLRHYLVVVSGCAWKAQVVVSP